jgi:hypothetical protein
MTPGVRSRGPIRELSAMVVRKYAPYAAPVSGGLLGLGSLFFDRFSTPAQVLLVVAVVALGAIGFLGITWRKSFSESATRRADEAETELDQLRMRLNESAPGTVLETVGSALFVTPGGWRITLLVLEPKADEWRLRTLVTRANSDVFERSAHREISLSSGLLREVLHVDANDPLRPFSNESTNLPDREVEPELWRSMHAQVIPGDPTDSGMPTRKFGWTVIKEPSSRRTLVLLSETVQADGIRSEVVRSQLLAPTIALISRMLGVSALENETESVSR